MSKTLIVGANSFLAQRLIQELKDNGNEVIGVFNDNKNNLKSKIKYHSVKQINQLKNDFNQVFIISGFLTSKELTIKENINKLYNSNVELIEKICTHFFSAKIIYVSSVSVFGYAKNNVSEVDDCKPDNIYGVSKLWGELIVKSVCENYSIVRLSPIYGEGMKENTFIPLIIEQALINKKILLFGDGNRAQNYLHIDDAIQFIISASLKSENEIYLACASESVTNNEVANIVKTHTKCSISYFGDDNILSIYYNNEKTRHKLNYQPNITLEEGLKSLIEWKRKKY